MTEEIKAIIEKNLPAQVGEILQKQLAEGVRNAKELEAMERLFNAETKRTTELRERIEEYKNLDDRNSKLEIREKSVTEKEFMLDMSVIKIQLEEANKRADMVMTFTNGLVRNTSFRKNIFDSENQAGYMGANNQWIQPASVNKSLTETNMEE